jgi:selenocysteine lyase/cysteine desulfurase
VGLDAALGIFECIDGGMQAVEQRILGLTAYAIAGLERLGYPVISPQGQGERSGIVCFSPSPEREDLNAERIAAELESRNIAVSLRSNILRVSPHFYNELQDIDALLNALEDLKRRPQEPPQEEGQQLPKFAGS